MSPRVYVRKFDWDEARRRHAAGESYAALAREYGVSNSAVQLACKDYLRARDQARASAWQSNGVCPVCGGRASRNRTTGQHRCMRCASVAAATSVRDGELRCGTCREWKPDDDFSRSASDSARRERNGTCRACGTVAKREYRARNRERERAYDRAYRRRRKAAA